MTQTIFGLPIRWQTSLDWRFAGTMAPRHLDGVIVARAGEYVIGLEPATGAVAWKYQVTQPILDGFVLEVCRDVAITDWRDQSTRRGHLVGVDAAGNPRWDVELASGVGLTAVKLDEQSVAVVVLATTWEIVVVDANGIATRHPLPSPGTKVARLPDGRWVVGAMSVSRDKPSLFVVSGGSYSAVLDAAAQVPVVRATTDHVITVERTGEARELVVRDHDLVARWRAPEAEELLAITPGRLWMAMGDPQHREPTAFDLATGEVVWRGDALPTPNTFVSASGSLVLFGHEEGGRLVTTSGDVLGDHEGTVGAIDASGDGALLYVDDMVTCLELPA